MPAGCDHLNEYLSLRDFGNFYRAVLIRLEIHFYFLVVAQETTRRIEADINAGIADGLIFWVSDDNLEPRRSGLGGLLFVFICVTRLALLRSA